MSPKNQLGIDNTSLIKSNSYRDGLDLLGIEEEDQDPTGNGNVIEEINKLFNETLSPKKKPYKTKIIWENVVGLILVHLLCLQFAWVALQRITLRMVLSMEIFVVIACLGVQIGAHRLWCHRSFKARWPLRLFLMLCQTSTLQKDIYDWCRDHRVHHKFSETDADPHNSKRGWFFAHVGWLMCKKHPDVISKGRTVDLSDLLADPIVYYQRKFYVPLAILLWGVAPTAYLHHVGGAGRETWLFCLGANLFRYMVINHATWSVNSSAHLFGTTPYDVHINPRENATVKYLSLGEGYHNYHHAFPADYSASELGWRGNFNPAAALIDFFAWIGLAYDRKRAPTAVVESRIERTGDRAQLQHPTSAFYDYFYAIWFVFHSVPLTFAVQYLYLNFVSPWL